MLESKSAYWISRLCKDIVHSEEYVFYFAWTNFFEFVALLDLLFVVSVETWKAELAV